MSEPTHDSLAEYHTLSSVKWLQGTEIGPTGDSRRAEIVAPVKAGCARRGAGASAAGEASRGACWSWATSTAFAVRGWWVLATGGVSQSGGGSRIQGFGPSAWITSVPSPIPFKPGRHRPTRAARRSGLLT